MLQTQNPCLALFWLAAQLSEFAHSQTALQKCKQTASVLCPHVPLSKASDGCVQAQVPTWDRGSPDRCVLSQAWGSVGAVCFCTTPTKHSPCSLSVKRKDLTRGLGKTLKSYWNLISSVKLCGRRPKAWTMLNTSPSAEHLFEVLCFSPLKMSIDVVWYQALASHLLALGWHDGFRISTAGKVLQPWWTAAGTAPVPASELSCSPLWPWQCSGLASHQQIPAITERSSFPSIYRPFNGASSLNNRSLKAFQFCF